MANAFLLRPLPAVSATSGATVSGSPLYLFNDFAGVVWQAVSGVIELRIDLGADQPVDTIQLFGIVAPSGTPQLQVYLATEAQGFFTGSYWSGTPQALFAGSVMPSSGKGCALWTAPTVSPPPASIRYLALAFTTAGGIQIARAVIGKRFQPGRNFSYGAGFGVKDLGSLDFSRRGVPLRARGAKLRTRSVEFNALRKDEAEAGLLPLLEYLGNTETVALCTDPAADAQRQNRCSFGWLVGEVGAKWRNSAAWTAAINQVATL